MGLNEGPLLTLNAGFAGVFIALRTTGVPLRSFNYPDTLNKWVATGLRGTLLLGCRVSRTVVI